MTGAGRAPRAQLLACYRSALDAVGGRDAVRRSLQDRPVQQPYALLAIGKAAAAMTEGVLDAQGIAPAYGLVITKHGHLGEHERLTGLRCLEAAHPVPDASSLTAGQALLDFLQRLPAGLPLIALISGGASSLVEVLPHGGDSAALERVNRWLLGSAMPIAEVNRVRRAVSCIKGGRLAGNLAGRTCRLLLISDVPGDDTAVIGSGLLVPANEPPAPPETLPVWLRPLAETAPPQPEPGAACFRAVETRIVANNRQARAAAAEQGRALGLTVTQHDTLVQGETAEAARALGAAIRRAGPGLHVWGGETTVTLPDNPGRGGRAQALALGVAQALDGGRPAWFLAAGTDGTDGPGLDAGALVDHDTCSRGRSAGHDAADALRRADAGSYLDATGDLISTGPTGTNVMDLMLALIPEKP